MIASMPDLDYTRFRSLILRRTGLDFPPSRRNDLASGLRRVWVELDGTLQGGLTYLDVLYAKLHDPDVPLWDIVIDTLTVCETHFFRNVPQFEALRDRVLPQIIATKRQAGDQSLRMWSAGCASGEEPYSLALLVRAVLPDWQHWQLDILGTDINRRALEKAQRGLYNDWSFREAHAQEWRDRYFHEVEGMYRLRDDVRAMVRFVPCNLITECLPPGNHQPMDLILCRNVVLYLGHTFRQPVYNHLHDALAPDGWLVVGHADPPPPNFAPFEAQPLPTGTFFRRQARRRQVSTSAGPKRDPAPLTLPRPVADQPASPGEAAADAEAHFLLGQWHADRQQWSEALRHCEQAIAFHPTHSEAYYLMALIHQNLDDPDQALEDLRRTIYLARDWALPRFTLAALYRQTGHLDLAQRELRNVIALTAALPPETPIPGSDGLTAARLRDSAERQLAQLL